MADETLSGLELTHRYADLGGVRLNYVEAVRGTPVGLLPGFPTLSDKRRDAGPGLAWCGVLRAGRATRG